MLCVNCGHKGTPAKITPGTFGMEVLLWLIFLVPGVIYSLWRLSAAFPGCPKCKAKNMIPEDSPIARKIIGSI